MKANDLVVVSDVNDRRPTVCFFAYVRDKKILELVEFYHNDIRILRELGFEVKIATKFSEIPHNCDLYYVWWWGTGVQVLIKARLSGRPIIMVGNVRFGKNAPYGLPHASGIKRLNIRMSWLFATAILTTSSCEHRIVNQYRRTNTFMVYHGIDTDLYKPSENDIREDILFTICNLYDENAKRKRIKEIIEAFGIILRKFPKYKLIISGGNAGFVDNTRANLEKLAENLGIKNKVIFTGSVSCQEKIQLYQKAKLFVQPSMYEGFGLAIAEAMACGTPVVVCRVGAVPEVAGGCGIYVFGDSEDIADGIMLSLADKELMDKLSMKSRQRILENFTYDRRKMTIKNIINTLVHHNRE